MWTKENRGRYDRDGLRYPSDLTDAEWADVYPQHGVPVASDPAAPAAAQQVV